MKDFGYSSYQGVKNPSSHSQQVTVFLLETTIFLSFSLQFSPSRNVIQLLSTYLMRCVETITLDMLLVYVVSCRSTQIWTRSIELLSQVSALWHITNRC